MTLAFHPYANIFELIRGSDFSELTEDVRKYGLREKIVVLDNQILDGRNRYLAALAAGLIKDDEEPDDRPLFFHRFVVQVDGDPLAYVISKNIHRRHLTIGQRAYAMAEYENFRHGGLRQAKQDANLQLEGMAAEPQETRADLADKGRVSERSIASAAIVRDQGVDDLKAAVKQGDLAISAAEKIARLPEQQQPQALAKHLPNGHRAIMGSRQEPDDSLDYFPTPPWATRALIERVLPVLGVNALGSVWEPACGEGHIAEVLREYVPIVHATDIHDGYGYGGLFNFLGDDRYPDEVTGVRWIITNPPFDEKALNFALRSFAHAGEGVALFVRWQWIETVGRYEKLFKPWPPTLVCPFAERVPLCKGEWKPTGSTATAYCWIVWHLPLSSAKTGTRLFWIPPGCRDALTKPDDADRFTAHPVKPRPTDSSGSPLTHNDDGEIIDPDSLPPFVKTVIPPSQGEEWKYQAALMKRRSGR